MKSFPNTERTISTSAGAQTIQSAPAVSASFTSLRSISFRPTSYIYLTSSHFILVSTVIARSFTFLFASFADRITLGHAFEWTV